MDIFKKLQDLKKNHSKVYDWIKAKAKLEGMTLTSVLSYYEKDVQKMVEVDLRKGTASLLGLLVEESGGCDG